MLFLCRWFLYLYPPAYRLEYSDEMLGVLAAVQADIRTEGIFCRAILCLQEVAGLIRGALREHLRRLTGSHLFLFTPRRITMRSEFRFPKAVVLLMTLVLVAILVAIDMARSIQASLPQTNPPVGPIHPAEFTVLPQLLVALLAACIAGLIAWAIAFALRRSGTQRLSQLNQASAQRKG